MKRFLLLASFIILGTLAKSQSAEGFYNRGNAKMIKEDFSGAIVDYNEAIRLRSTFSMAYYNRANAKARMNDFQGALDDLNECLKQEPMFANGYYSRGLAKKALKDYSGAIAQIPSLKFYQNSPIV